MNLNGFEYQPLDEPSLLRRMIRGGFSDNAFREIRNHLAGAPVTSLTSAQVDAILARYELSRRDAHAAFTGIYRTLLSHHTSDRHLSAEDRSDLAHLRAVLALGDDDVAAIDEDVLGALLRVAFAEAFADRRLSGEERQRLEEMAVNFNLPEETVRQLHRHQATKSLQLVHDVMPAGDTRDEEMLAVLARDAGVHIDATDPDHPRPARRHRLARIMAGGLPDLSDSIDLPLAGGEACHAQAVGILDHAAAPAAASARHPRLLSGVHFRYGRVALGRATHESVVDLDPVVMFLTSARIIFQSSAHTTTLALTDVAGFTLYDDALRIELASGRHHLFVTDTDLPVLGAILDVALRVVRRDPVQAR